ncbi:MAG: CPBP family intramembrane metalloprotease [Clostridiaceae bacterium]|nr:CPBP family intramembrane metalloprotease [Clostridiaceae bacterium]
MNGPAGIRTVSVGRQKARPEPEGARSVRHAAGTALLLHALLSILLQFCWYLVPDGFWGLDKSGLTGYVAAIVLMQGFCILLPSLLSVWWHAVPGWVVTGRRSAGFGTILMALVLGIPAAVMLLSLNNVVVYLMAKTGWKLPVTILPVDYAATGLASVLLLLLVSALLPAILEELMFRGVLQGSMLHAGGRMSAILLTSAAFAVFHCDPLFLVAPFGAGLILGYLRLHTDNLLPCIAAHFALNASIRLIRPILPQLSAATFARYAQTGEPLLYASIAAFFLSAAVVIPLTLMTGGVGRLKPGHTAISNPYPADWKYLLATLLLVVTIGVVYFAVPAA